MRRQLTVAVALSIFVMLCMIGGVAIGRYTATTSHPEKTSQPEELSAVSGPEEGQHDALVSKDQEPGENGAPLTGSSEGELSSEIEAELQDVIDGIPVIAPPRGAGAITGTILSKDGLPLAGASAYAFSQERGGLAMALPRDPGQPGDPVSSVVELVNTQRRIVEHRHHATTDANGEFVIEGLSERTLYSVTAYLEGWEIIDRGIRSSRSFNWRESTQHGRLKRDVRPGEAVHFLAEPRVRLPIDVSMPDGSVPEVARVFYRRAGDGGHSGFRFGHWYPSRPYLLLEPGTWEVSARVGEDHEFTSSSQTVVLQADLASDLVTLEVKARTAISGRVLFTPGEAQTRAVVYFAKAPAGPDDPVTTLLRTGQMKTAEHGRSYQFWYKDMVPGSYLIGVGRIRGEILEWRALDIEQGVVHFEELTVPPLRKGGYLALKVEGPDGSPLDDVHVELVFAGGRSDASTRRGDGIFWVPVPGPGFVSQSSGASRHVPASVGAASTLTLRVTSIEYGQKTVTLDRRTPTVSVRFEEPGQLEVIIPDFAGSDFEERLRLRAYRLSDSGGRELKPLIRIAATRDRQIFSGVSPGECEVVFEIKNNHGFWGPVASHRVTVRAGENSVTLPLPSLPVSEQ